MAPPLSLRPPRSVRPLRVRLAPGITVNGRTRLLPEMVAPFVPAVRVTLSAVTTRVVGRTRVGQLSSNRGGPPFATVHKTLLYCAQSLTRGGIPTVKAWVALSEVLVFASVTITSMGYSPLAW